MTKLLVVIRPRVLVQQTSPGAAMVNSISILRSDLKNLTFEDEANTTRVEHKSNVRVSERESTHNSDCPNCHIVKINTSHKSVIPNTFIFISVASYLATSS